MGQKKGSDQKRAAIRVCPECAKAFYALESENAVCCFYGAQTAETQHSKKPIATDSKKPHQGVRR